MVYVIKGLQLEKVGSTIGNIEGDFIEKIRCLEIRRRGNTREMYQFLQYQNSSRRMISSTNILLMINWLRRFILDETISIQLIYMFRNLARKMNIENRY